MSGAAPERAEELMAQVRELLGHARELLQDPDPQNIDSSCSDLLSAFESLTNVQSVIAESGGKVRCSAESAAIVRNDVNVISRLLESAASFHSNLLHRMLEASRALEASRSSDANSVALAQNPGRAPLTLTI